MSIDPTIGLFHFSGLPVELQLQILCYLDIPDIESGVRPTSKAWRALANDSRLWKEIASMIGYDIPDSVENQNFYAEVKKHIIEVRRKASHFPREVFEIERSTTEEEDKSLSSVRRSLLEEKVSIRNVREIKKRMEPVELENTITVWKSIQEQIPTLQYPDFDALDNGTEKRNISRIFQTWILENRERLSDCKELTLFSRQISYLPEALRYLPNVQILDLGHNALHHLPEWIGEWSTLREMYIDGNLIHSLPEQVGNLKELQKLSIAYNHNTWLALPNSIAELPKLRELDLSFCFVSNLPEKVKDLPQLELFLEGTRFRIE